MERPYNGGSDCPGSAHKGVVCSACATRRSLGDFAGSVCQRLKATTARHPMVANFTGTGAQRTCSSSMGGGEVGIGCRDLLPPALHGLVPLGQHERDLHPLHALPGRDALWPRPLLRRRILHGIQRKHPAQPMFGSRIILQSRSCDGRQVTDEPELACPDSTHRIRHRTPVEDPVYFVTSTSKKPSRPRLPASVPLWGRRRKWGHFWSYLHSFVHCRGALKDSSADNYHPAASFHVRAAVDDDAPDDDDEDDNDDDGDDDGAAGGGGMGPLDALVRLQSELRALRLPAVHADLSNSREQGEQGPLP